MDEGNDRPDVLKGCFIDMFDDRLSVIEDPVLVPGSVGLWYDVSRIDRKLPAQIIALSARAEKIEITPRGLKFTSRAPSEMTVAARIYTARPPKSVKVISNGETTELPFEYEPDSMTSYFIYPSDGNPARVRVTF